MNTKIAKAFTKGNRSSGMSTPRLPPKKNILAKPSSGRLDELDNFLLKVENVFTLDKAHYPTDLDKIYYAAGLLEGQAANGTKISTFWTTRKWPFKKEGPSIRIQLGSPGHF